MIIGAVIIDRMLETATHFDAKTASLPNISEKIVAFAATGIDKAVTVIAAGKGGTPTSVDIRNDNTGMIINLTIEERYTLQSLNKVHNFAVLITPPTISIDKGIVIFPTAFIAPLMLAGTGILRRKIIVPMYTAIIAGFNNTLFTVIPFVPFPPNIMYP